MSAGQGVPNPLCKAGEDGEVVEQLTRVLPTYLCQQEACVCGTEAKQRPSTAAQTWCQRTFDNVLEESSGLAFDVEHQVLFCGRSR